MSTENKPQDAEPAEAPRKPLSEAAKRALAEAAARKIEPSVPSAKEFNGRSGPDPVRYGDWEVKGLASDF
jgi:hypothetical protein